MNAILIIAFIFSLGMIFGACLEGDNNRSLSDAGAGFTFGLTALVLVIIVSVTRYYTLHPLF